MSVHCFGGRGRGLGLSNIMKIGKTSKETEKVPFEEPALVAEDKDNEINQTPQKKEKKSLPISEYKDEIIDNINENSVTIISALTGSGKVRKNYLC